LRPAHGDRSAPQLLRLAHEILYENVELLLSLTCCHFLILESHALYGRAHFLLGNLSRARAAYR